MPRGPERQWRRRKEPQTDHLIAASVQGGMVDTDRGFYKTLLYGGIETQDRAAEVRRSMFRAAKRQGVSLKADIEALPGEFQIRFHAIDKTKARAWMIRTYGADRSRWPYNPRRPNPPRGEAA